jgi:hypothetical protein
LAPNARGVKRPSSWLSRFAGSRPANESAQPKKTGRFGLTLVPAGVARLGWKRPFSSQVGEERFDLKLNVARQAPQSLPVEHPGSLFCVGAR